MNGQKLFILGCSAGPDSMALFGMLKERRIPFICAHVNYHLREEAEEESRMLRDYCLQQGVVFERLDAEIQPGNMEQQAREIRYRFFAQLYKRYNADCVLIAHQMDDALETYLMQKQRKTIPDTYGLKKLNRLYGCPVYRPLLNLSKEECRRYCEEHRIPYCIDSSNNDEKYTRNRWRKTIQALSLPQREALIRQMQSDQKQRSHEIRSAKAFIRQKPLRVQTFLNHDYPHEILRQLLYKDLSSAHLDELIDQMSHVERFHNVIRHKILECYDGQILVYAKPEAYAVSLQRIEYRTYPEFTLADQGQTIEGLTLSDDDFPITVRSPKPGDKIQLRIGNKSLHRHFIDRKIPHYQRLLTPVVEARDGRVIFASGIGCDVGHWSIHPNFFVLKCWNMEDIQMHNDIERILITEAQIEARCEELGQQIDKDYEDKHLTMVGLLKGSVPFMAELMKHVHSECEIDFMSVSSYCGTESMGDVRINKDLDGSIQGEDILLVEDIVDTGRTLKTVKELLYSKGASSVKIVSLLDKPERRVVEINADYVGFTVPNYFVVGYGLDYNQKYRNLPYVGILKESCY